MIECPLKTARRQELEIAAGLYTRKDLETRRQLTVLNLGRALIGEPLLTGVDLILHKEKLRQEAKAHKKLLKRIKKGKL